MGGRPVSTPGPGRSETGLPRPEATAGPPAAPRRLQRPTALSLPLASMRGPTGQPRSSRAGEGARPPATGHSPGSAARRQRLSDQALTGAGRHQSPQPHGRCAGDRGSPHLAERLPAQPPNKGHGGGRHDTGSHGGEEEEVVAAAANPAPPEPLRPQLRGWRPPPVVEAGLLAMASPAAAEVTAAGPGRAWREP